MEEELVDLLTRVDSQIAELDYIEYVSIVSRISY